MSIVNVGYTSMAALHVELHSDMTGVVGDPRMTTTKIKNPTRYVPYGIMITNNNTYQWNRPYYIITKGRLPNGMQLLANGEWYGFPTQTGNFEITVRMNNSSLLHGINDTTAAGDYLIIFRGVFNEYTDLYIDGRKLTLNQDYKAEAGSTRITIVAKSLPKSEGVHKKLKSIFICLSQINRHWDH